MTICCSCWAPRQHLFLILRLFRPWGEEKELVGQSHSKPPSQPNTSYGPVQWPTYDRVAPVQAGSPLFISSFPGDVFSTRPLLSTLLGFQTRPPALPPGGKWTPSISSNDIAVNPFFLWTFRENRDFFMQIEAGWFQPTPLKNDGVRQLGWWNSQYIPYAPYHPVL